MGSTHSREGAAIGYRDLGPRACLNGVLVKCGRRTINTQSTSRPPKKYARTSAGAGLGWGGWSCRPLDCGLGRGERGPVFGFGLALYIDTADTANTPRTSRRQSPVLYTAESRAALRVLHT
jgi:hypothetical protein